MRILFTNFRAPWDPLAGGGQAATGDLAAALVRRGHRVTAVFGGKASAASVPYDVAWATVSVRPVVAALQMAMRVRAVIADCAPEVVHATGYEGAFLPRAGARVMTTHHPDLPAWAPPAWLSAASRLRYLRWNQVAWLEREALRKADLAFFVSASARDRAATRGYRTSRSRIVPNGVDSAAFFPRPQAGVPEPPTIVFAGRMDDQKGVDVLLRAAGRLPPRTRVRLAGGGWKEAEYRRLAADLRLQDRVEFLGHVPRNDLPALLRTATVITVPSRYENLPLSVLEAMASGVPVVATAVGGVPEMVTDGVEGILVPAEDAGALGEALARLVIDTSLARRMGLAGRRRVEAEFTWDSVAARVEAAYSELLEARPCRPVR